MTNVLLNPWDQNDTGPGRLSEINRGLADVTLDPWDQHDTGSLVWIHDGTRIPSDRNDRTCIST